MSATTHADVRARLAEVLGAEAVGILELAGLESRLPLALPASEAQLIELLRFAARERLAVVPCGLGSKLGWCAPPARADFAVSTRRLAGVVAYEPGDGTLTARAGSTIAALSDIVRTGGHHLSPDVARPERSTLGGVLAAGESGVDRLRYGPVRHQVLGMKVALGDGTLAKSGGRLVKNVTGFDLHRLYTGSHGTLCMILEASLRLYPLPEEVAWFSKTCATSGEALALAQRALSTGARLYSLQAWFDPLNDVPSPWTVRACVRGRAEVVEAESADLAGVWAESDRLTGDEARSASDAAREMGFEVQDEPYLQIGSRPSRVGAVLRATDDTCRRDALALRVRAQPGFGLIDVQPRTRDGARPETAALVELTRNLRTALAPLEVTVALRNAGAALSGLDPFGELAPGLDIMKRLKSALDPLGVFASGRFHAGL